MSYRGLGFTASASLSTSGGFNTSTSSLPAGSSIDWGMVCSGKGGLASKSYVSDADYSFKCGDGFGCRKKPGSSDVCGYSSGSAPPPPPPSFQPFAFVAASYGPSLSTIASAAKPAPTVSYIPGLSFSSGTKVTSYLPTPSSEAAPPPPPPSSQPFAFVAASYGPSLSTIASAAKPAPTVSYIPGLSFSRGTKVTSYLPTPSSEAAPPVATPTGPVEEKNEWIVPAVVVGGLIVAGAIFYFARKN